VNPKPHTLTNTKTHNMGLGFTGRRTHQFLGGVPGPDSLEQIRHIEATNCAARAVGSSATTRPLQDRLYQQVRSRSFDAEHARAFEIQRAHLGIYDLEKTVEDFLENLWKKTHDSPINHLSGHIRGLSCSSNSQFVSDSPVILPQNVTKST
jgi:hypothetical protein